MPVARSGACGLQCATWSCPTDRAAPGTTFTQEERRAKVGNLSFVDDNDQPAKQGRLLALIARGALTMGPSPILICRLAKSQGFLSRVSLLDNLNGCRRGVRGQ